MNPAVKPRRFGSAARRGRPGYDQDQVLAVCVDVFIRHGYDATSMTMLSDALGLSRAAIYHHVDSKEHLLGLALDRALGALEAIVASCRALDADSGERVRRVVHDTVALLIDELPYVTLLLRVRGNTSTERRAMERRRRITHDVERMIAAAQADGYVRTDASAQLLARLTLGAINSVTEWYRPEGPADRDDVVAQVTRVVNDSLRPAA